MAGAIDIAPRASSRMRPGDLTSAICRTAISGMADCIHQQGEFRHAIAQTPNPLRIRSSGVLGGSVRPAHLDSWPEQGVDANLFLRALEQHDTILLMLEPSPNEDLLRSLV